ncbi:hypothetical protein E3T54_02090 [Cryobacterium sp. Sr8]|uniref:hypothetical protein n=1 Tax=Cryobacterium sp. Sr8 TaxID=1259203 RepID=UPI001069C4FC|nr:hypothetical protein [Cryobacterium sp. Sr8]TFD81288.1 hypothetical protein E3T54_02090 [Cryobacterium sp. Sr8]
MILRDTPITGRPRSHVFRSVIVSVLATAALLLGLFAAHSSGAGVGAEHEMAVAAPGASAPAEYLTGANEMVASAGADVVVAVASGLEAAWLSFGDDVMAGCGILAMTCSVLLIVVALIRLAREPSVCSQLLDAGDFVVSSFRTIPLHVHRPSLILLSISRI